MTLVNLVCSGPGPHIPASGILGQTSNPSTPVRCPSAACRVTEDANVNLAATNTDALKTKAAQALTANATFLALASPTAAQVAAQVKLLTRETNAVIRLLVLQSLTDISDT